MTLVNLAAAREQIDEYGFIIMSQEERYDWRKFLARLRNLKGGSTVGMSSQCKGLCKYLVHKTKMPNTQQMLTMPGMYWCKECQVIMKIARCRCCGNLGRKKARHRNRDNEKRIG